MSRQPRTDLWSWFWLALGAALMLFANGADTIALAAWLAPVFLLRFVRRQRALVGLPIAFVVLAAVFAFQFRGMVPIPGIFYCLFLILVGILGVMPYLLDRLLAPRLSGLASTLVFPTTWVAVEYLFSRGPYGSWGSIAYSQYGNLALLQLLSVTGLWGITFLIGWFAAVSNRAWEEGFASMRIRADALLCAGVIAMVFLLGGARLAFAPPSAPTVRVATLAKMEVTPIPSDAMFYRMLRNESTSTDRAAILRWTTATNNNLLSRAAREMKAGAKIVFWGETNALVLQRNEAAFIARGSALATKYHAYLGMALGVLDIGKKPPYENKFVLIEPNGQVAWTYDKVHPVPGPNTTLQVRGNGKLRESDTPYGRLSAIICFDGDFPQLLAQAGTLGADIVLDPSNDWRAIDPWHTRMASFRGIEQGFNLVRATSGGLSAAFDYQGRRLAAVDYYRTTDPTMISAVPTKGVRTIYSRLGNWFAWLSIAALLALIAKSLGVLPNRKSQTN
ncbi:MAG: nitrilase-related carbon-nitrogen hydrolase [Gammaproteobacteria bacterium]